MAGEETYMNLSKDGSIENFWGLVVEQQWQASIVRGERTFFAPWSLIRTDLSQPTYSVHVSPDSSYAFKLLVKFCASEKIGQDCVAAALAVVLMLPQSTVEVKFPPLSAAPVDTMNSNGPREGWREKLYKHFGSYKESYYDEMFQCLNQCITMSCTLEGTSSLLCGALFDPTVPCNLTGAHLSGIAEVIEPILDNHEAVARLMAKKNPSTSPFWLAAIWTDQAREAVTSTLAGMPPLSLPMASWTGTHQSFLQFSYQAITGRAKFLTRAGEFQSLYLITPSATIPFTSSPPFDEIAVFNTNLEIRAHLSHNHSPIQYKLS